MSMGLPKVTSTLPAFTAQKILAQAFATRRRTPAMPYSALLEVVALENHIPRAEVGKVLVAEIERKPHVLHLLLPAGQVPVVT